MKGGATERVVIPELEELAKSYVPRGWSEHDKAIVRAYMGRVSADDIARFLEVKRSGDAVKSMIRRLEAE